MSCTVPHELKLLQASGDSLLPATKVSWAMREGSMSGRNPERRVVAPFHEIAPEAEAQLRNDFAMDLGLSPVLRRSLSRLHNVGASLRIQLDDVTP